VASEANSQKVMDQHTRVFEAIKARDPVTASKAMLEHVIFAEKEIRKHLA
jgi:DNA-binding FadR family transcriptional regulator